MRLKFLGTRGNIRMASDLHRRHAALLLQTPGVRVLVDAGDDWTGSLEGLRPDAILVTHAHPDHAGALRGGAPCPVYASESTAELLARYPIEVRPLQERSVRRLGGLAFSAHAVSHSLRAPAVGFRFEEGRSSVFYVPDVLEIDDLHAALDGVGLFVGDGATWGRPIVRHREGAAYGHARIETQLDWCARARVGQAIFTHCGTRIVRMDPGEAEALVARFGREHGVPASVAADGDAIEIGSQRRRRATASSGGGRTG